MAAKKTARTRKSTSKGSDRKRRKPAGRSRSVAKGQTRGIPFIQTIIIVLVALTAAVGYVWQQENIKMKKGTIETLNRDGARLVKDIGRLDMEVERLTAPGRIKRIAVEKLGMSAPDRWQPIPVRLNEIPRVDGTNP